MSNRRLMQIPSPRYFLDLDYVLENGTVCNFEDAKYSYALNEWEYISNEDSGLIAESRLSELITEDEEHRVALDYEREEMFKQKLYKKIGIY